MVVQGVTSRAVLDDWSHSGESFQLPLQNGIDTGLRSSHDDMDTDSDTHILIEVVQWGKHRFSQVSLNSKTTVQMHLSNILPISPCNENVFGFVFMLLEAFLSRCLSVFGIIITYFDVNIHWFGAAACTCGPPNIQAPLAAAR